MKEVPIDRNLFHFILVRNNKACALVQQGQNRNDVIVELLDKENKTSILKEIADNLLLEPDSAYMASIGNWEYMKEFCYKQMNLYRDYLWAYFDPSDNEVKCGFEIHNFRY